MVTLEAEQLNVPHTHRLYSPEDLRASAATWAPLALSISRDYDYLTLDPFGRPSEVKQSYARVSFSGIKCGSRFLWESRTEVVTADVGPETIPMTGKRGTIIEWTPRSRERMRQVLAELDYRPMFMHGLVLPKMITLTLPHRWEELAPTAKVMKSRLMDRFWAVQYKRAWGTAPVAVWKLEFQNRRPCEIPGHNHDPRAPHLHILMAPPAGSRPHGRGDEDESFESWLRRRWADVCRLPDATEQEYRDHLAKGVHIEDVYGVTGTDPKRIADYFSKHGMFSDKEYQHEVPELWKASPGRFWGYWGLAKGGEDVMFGQVDPSKPAGPGAMRDRVAAFLNTGSSVARRVYPPVIPIMSNSKDSMCRFRT